jgi:chitinase
VTLPDGAVVTPSHDGGKGGGAADGSTTPVGDGGEVVASGQWVMGYYVGYDINAYPIASIDWTGLTHIIFGSITVNTDQTLNLGFSDQNGTGEADAKAIATAAHANGAKAILMLGGQGAGPNIAAAATPANLPAFVTALTGAMTTLGYDGIDLDWEDSVSLPNLVALAQGLRAAQPSMILTYPGGVINANFPTVDPQYATLAKSLDRFNIQSYYPTTAAIGSGWDSWFLSPLSGESGSTPIAIDDTMKRYAAAGIPKAKLGMGTAFYAICYSGGITGPRQPTSSQSIKGGDNAYPLSAFFAAGSTFATSATTNQMRDTTAQEPYLTYTSAVTDAKCGATQYISYEDETSLEAKGTFSKTNGYGGIIIWTIQEGWLPSGAAGGRAQNSLMQALKTGFIDP